MVKTALKNFFKNFVYLFIAMGIVYLFLLLVIFWLVQTAGRDVGTMFNDVTALLKGSVDLSSASVTEFLTYAYEQIDWDRNFFSVITQIIQTRWITSTVKGFFGSLSASVEGFDEKLKAILSVFKQRLTVDISVAASWIVLGILLANFATGFAIRRRSAKRDWKKFLLSRIVVPVVQTAVIVLSLVALSVLRFYGLFVAVFLLAVLGFLSLLSSWIVFGQGAVKLKEVVTAKNMLKNILAAGVILLIDIALATGLFFLNVLLCVLLMIPIFIYSFNIIAVNTDSYVAELSSERKSASDNSAVPPTENSAEKSAEEPADNNSAENP